METSIKPWNIGKTPRKTNNEVLLNMNEDHGEPWKSRENWIKTMEKFDEHRGKSVKRIEDINEKPFKMKKTTEQMMKIKVWYKSMKPMKKTHIQKHHGSIDENRGKMMNIVKKR